MSLAVNYTHSAQFRAAGYTPFMVDGVEYGEVRQYGNFSFARIYESGHEVPYYQPKASLEFFRRVLTNKAISDGVSDVIGTYGTTGDAIATHVESGAPARTTSMSQGGSTPMPTTSATIASTSSAAGTAVSPTKTPNAARRSKRILWW